MATDIIARGMAAGVVSQVSADRQAVSEDRAAVESAKTEVLNVAESIPKDYSTLSANVSELKEDLVNVEDYIFESITSIIPITSIQNIVKMEHFNGIKATNGIFMQAHNSYDTYYVVLSEDCDIYADDVQSSYFAICYGTNYTHNISDTSGNITLLCSDSVRYRKSEGNVPTSSSKLHVVKGGIVAFTVPTGGNENIGGFSTSRKVKESFKEEVTSEISANKMKIKYSSDDNGHVYVYVKASVGYVMYDFIHTVDSAKNSNIWRIDKAYAYDDSLVKRFDITTTGEWECAVHLKDRSDFSGGMVHGDEKYTDVVFIVNGSVVDITTYSDITEVDSFSVIECSKLYDPNDGTTVIAEHGSEHIFGKEIIINQSLIWKVNDYITSCYMAMHLPAKAITDKWYSDKTFVPTTIQNPLNASATKAKKVCVYSSDGTVTTEMEIVDYPAGYTGGDLLLLTDNGGNAYNKCYFVISNASSGIAITQNTFWKTKTIYRFNIGK